MSRVSFPCIGLFLNRHKIQLEVIDTTTNVQGICAISVTKIVLVPVEDF